MVEVNFLGGCLQIGGSAVGIETPAGTVLLDYGIFMEKTPMFPAEIRPKELSAVLLSHAHLDHSGGIPLLYSGTATPRLLATRLTIDLARVLIEDMIRISEYYLPFGKPELFALLNRVHAVQYDKVKVSSHCVVQFMDAGHIPGSSAFYLELNGKRILYTGDYNAIDTQLLRKARLKASKIDAVIIESTYALEDHPNREEIEKDFVEKVNTIVSQEGTVLIPAFGVARSQEILCVLMKYGFKYPIFVDGMARKVCHIFSDNGQSYQNYFRDYKLLKKAIQRSHCISKGRTKVAEREKAVHTPGVIIAPSGMLKGGTAVSYMDELYQSARNGVFLVSFQIPETPGQVLVDEMMWGDKEVSAKVQKFRFSSHAGRTELWELIHSMGKNPDATVFCMHGEEEACKTFAREIEETTKLNAIAPNSGES
ncbi:MAG: MBL fold metallo-hydrolase, partial [Promethearchaeota archaeon]